MISRLPATGELGVTRWIGTRLQLLRHASDLCLETTAERAGIPLMVLRRYEAGQDRPAPAHLIALLNLFGVTVTAFFAPLPPRPLPSPMPGRHAAGGIEQKKPA